MQLGASLAAVLPTAPVTTWVYAAGTITGTSSTKATISLPLVDGNGLQTSTMGLNKPLSTFKIIGGTYDGYFCNILTTPVTDTTVTFSVETGGRTPFSTSTVQTGFSLQHVAAKSFSNPYQDLVIDEHVDEIAPGTSGPFPFPTGWVPGGAVPADAYLVVIHDEQESGGARSLYKDKLAVVKKVFNSTTKLSTLTVRRASAGHGDAGRFESFLTNRYFPCSFGDRAGGVANVNVGVDVTGGWTRPLAAFPAGDNGMSLPDRGIGRLPSTSGSGLMPGRQLYNGTAKITNFRSGYYGHADYHDQWTTAAPFTPNTIAANGAYPYEGNEFWLSLKLKYSPTMAGRVDSTKLFFIDQWQQSAQAQIVGSSTKVSRTNWHWFHNYASQPNSTFPLVSWDPPIDEWFALKIHIQAGHDNCIEYRGADTDFAVTTVSNKVDTPGAERLTITCGTIPLNEALIDPATGRYYASPQNPDRLDPQRSGYFGSSTDYPGGIRFAVSFKDGTWANNSRKFVIVDHTYAAGVNTFVVTKNNPADPWRTDEPLVGDKIRVEWVNMDTSARYKDTHIELYKREAADSGWVQLASFDHAITYNAQIRKGTALTIQNPPGWNNFQPTGYANIDDCNPPHSHTIWTRYAQVILSQADQSAPALP